MFEKPNFSKFHQLDGAILILFNSLLLDLLLVGYAGSEDKNTIGKVIGDATLGGIFQATILICFLFFFYYVLAKEPLIRLLTFIYLPVVCARYIFFPFWYAGGSVRLERFPLRKAWVSWKMFCDYQLNTQRVGRQWTAMQHLSVATFFLLLVSISAPLWGFLSMPYRIIPDMLMSIGVPDEMHWVGIWGFGSIISYMCSNGMLALFGDHAQGFSIYENKKKNLLFIDAIEEKLRRIEKMKEELATLDPSSCLETTPLDESIDSLIDVLHEASKRVGDNLEGDHRVFIDSFILAFRES